MPSGSTAAFRTDGSISGGELEPAFADEHGVARRKWRAERNDGAHGAAGFGVGDGDDVALGAGREAASDRDRALDAHVRHVRVLAGRGDFAENEERTIGIDLDGNRGLADKAV